MAKESKTSQVVKFCDKLFSVERGIQQFSLKDKYQVRMKKSKPILDEFWKWIGSFQVLSGSKLGKSVSYALNNKNGLIDVLLVGRRAIQKNCLA